MERQPLIGIALGSALALLVPLVLLPAPPARAAASDEVVVREAGATRVDTAIAAARAGWERSEVAVLATAEAFPDALVGGPLAARLDAPLLLTGGSTLSGAAAEELERLAVQRVVILGGERAVSAAVAEAVTRLDGRPAVTRVAGDDRWATAARAADGAAPGGTVVLAPGGGFPDALAGSSLPVGAERATVLLAERDRLPDATGAALERLAPERIVLVGGPVVLSESVATAAAEAADRGRADAAPARVDRLAGPTRYGTSAAVLSAGLAALDAAPRSLVIATGAAFPDALAAGALAARLEGLAALTPRFRLDDEVEALVRGHADRFDRVVVLGGSSVVDRDVLEELDAALSGAPRPPAALHLRTTEGGFRGVARPLPAAVAEEMTGVSWEPGCPVPLEDLVLLEVTHRRYAGEAAEGELVVAAGVAADVLDAFAALHTAGFPVARMERIDAYGGDDDASMAADNTSAFNCRRVTGGERWSEHAYGTAIDVNPVRNPYVRGDTVLPEAGRAYLDRGDVRPGMAVRPGAMVEAFEAIGWGWGGDWSSSKDYQHVSLSGR